MKTQTDVADKGYPTKEFTLLTGHRVSPVPACLGYYMVEAATEGPQSNTFFFSHDENAKAIIAEHNRLWEEKYGLGETE